MLKFKKITLMAALGAAMGFSSMANADVNETLANICTIVEADDKGELRKKMRAVNSDYRLKLRDYYSGITCGGQSLIKSSFNNNSIDGCFSHMLYCMALSTQDLQNLNKEIYRILKPGGINIYTVRHTKDGDYKHGIHIGEDLYENDGFIVHFFSEEKIKKLSKGFNILEIKEFEEGTFPRKLFKVTLEKKLLTR